MPLRNLAAAAAAATTLGLSAMPAAAVTIDFEEQSFGAAVASPLAYPEVSFASSTGLFAIDGAGVLSRDICTYSPGTCDGTLTVTFAAPVYDLSFQTRGENAPGTLFVQILFQGGGSTDIELGYDNIFATLDTHDLAAWSNIIGLVMSSNDGNGVTYDNFTFTVGDGGTGGIPEPAAWALMITGFGLVGGMARRRRMGTA